MSMTDISSEKRQKKLGQIQALLDRADHPNTPPEEAESARQKADDMMLAYAIEQYEVDQRKDKDLREPPTARLFDICAADSPIKPWLLELAFDIARHCRCKMLAYWADSPSLPAAAKLFGFASDIDYAEMLFVSLRVQMSAGLEPRPDPSLSFEENLAMLKESGMKWARIHDVLEPEVPWDRKRGVQYTGIYTKFCKDRGRERMYTSPLSYQKNFAMAFVSRVNRRLYEIRSRQVEMTSGKELVLFDRGSEVQKFFDENKGKTKNLKTAQVKYDGFAQNRGADAGDRADLGQRRVDRRRELT